ncbi:MAG TPA: lysine--tRNA ligase, partial [Desulfurella acetivorans]|nr:lysine--tRNA ligase [Desulfurella acetivorans]
MNEDGNKLIKRRIEKLEEIKALGIDPYFNGFTPEYFLNDIASQYINMDAEQLKEIQTNFKIAGRIISIRDFGKAAFLKLKDMSGTLQVYCQKNVLGDQYSLYKKLDIGDIIGIEGNVFKTKTQEVTINAQKLYLLTKSIRPLPEKFHGLQDKELRYRQRYVDLIVNDDVRETFFKRSRIIALIREFMINNKFLEVETPMLHKLVGGALAKPFITHLNALDLDMYLRIAPELYLKRLVVGGLERVFEINRNFRNEGMDLKHNPEFTMMEFYCAYREYN